LLCILVAQLSLLGMATIGGLERKTKGSENIMVVAKVVVTRRCPLPQTKHTVLWPAT
jgi:hypothetical protein